MEKKPSFFPEFFFVPEAQESENNQFFATKKTQKRKYNHKPEIETNRGAEQSGILTELNHYYCDMIMEKKKKKLRLSEIDAADENPEQKQYLDSITPSTELTLFDESWTAHSVFQNFSANRKDPALSKESLSDKLKRKKLEQNIAKLRDYQEIEDPKTGVSTELKLFDPWKIKKRLTGSDLGNLSRLLVPSELVKSYVFYFLNKELVDKIEQNGAKFVIWDCDTETKHHLVFKQWHTSKSYVFIDGWIQYFGNRRNLKQGDVIGLYWDLSNSRFNFSVRQRAAAI